MLCISILHHDKHINACSSAGCMDVCMHEYSCMVHACVFARGKCIRTCTTQRVCAHKWLTSSSYLRNSEEENKHFWGSRMTYGRKEGRTDRSSDSYARTHVKCLTYKQHIGKHWFQYVHCTTMTTSITIVSTVASRNNGSKSNRNPPVTESVFQ